MNDAVQVQKHPPIPPDVVNPPAPGTWPFAFFAGMHAVESNNPNLNCPYADPQLVEAWKRGAHLAIIQRDNKTALRAEWRKTRCPPTP